MRYKFKALALLSATALEPLQFLLNLCAVLTARDVGFTFSNSEIHSFPDVSVSDRLLGG